MLETVVVVMVTETGTLLANERSVRVNIIRIHLLLISRCSFELMNMSRCGRHISLHSSSFSIGLRKSTVHELLVCFFPPLHIGFYK